MGYFKHTTAVVGSDDIEEVTKYGTLRMCGRKQR